MKPTLPKGTRDFDPSIMLRRQYIMDTLRQIFIQFGYMPLETPALENLSTLEGKYGEEGDKLMYRIINSGDYLKKANKSALQNQDAKALLPSIAEKGLRYDLTIPFARFVAMNQHALAFPFKRYQIQPVWRADRPQRGRYREFYQCDVDVVGSTALLNELELIQIYDMAFAALQLPVSIRINHRKILTAMAKVCLAEDRAIELITLIDKLDKIGIEGIAKQLQQRNFPAETFANVKQYLAITELPTNKEKLAALSEFCGHHSEGKTGIEELSYLFDLIKATNLQNDLLLDTTLARGLDYYTGPVFEVSANVGKMGSIGGGGRYDNLTGTFGLPNVAGVGVSFGLDRIFVLLEEQSLFPDALTTAPVQILFINFESSSVPTAIQYANQLRDKGLKASIYPDVNTKLKKVMKYADANNIPYVALIGTQELANKTIAFKNMKTGKQEQLTIQQVIQVLQQA